MIDNDVCAVPPKTGFAPRHGWDRNAVLVLLLIIWVGILMGFGGDIAHHYVQSGLNYPLIVHIHAAAFVGWMVLLTTQILLVRAGNYGLHKKLGVAAIALAAAMVVLGPMAEIIVDRMNAGAPDSDPAFMSIAFAGIFLFAVLVTAALILRTHGPSHKRLMMLAIIAICNAGFTRWLGSLFAGWFGHSPAGFWGVVYLVPTTLVASIGIYDLITRRRLLPAYVAGALLCVLTQVTSIWLYFSPAWLAFTTHLSGH